MRPTAALVLALALFSFFLTCFFFLKDGALYWDNAQHYAQFRDNLHSLNAYGEVAWWFPHVQGGWPSYYYSILGFPHGASPLFALVAAGAWLGGRVGVTIVSYLPIYVVYFGLLAPLLFLASLRAFATCFLKDERAVVYALVLGAFSPGVMLNVSDIGFLEPTAYGLFTAAALLVYLRTPSRRHFWRLGLCLVALGLSLGFAFLFWNAVALPVFAGLLLALAGRHHRRVMAEALRRLGAKGAVSLAGLFLAGALPNLVAYAQGHDTLIKPHLAGVAYAFEDLRPGNPLSPLVASIPGLGTKWAPGYRENWALAEKESGQHIGYIYMGLLCVPLALIGLTRARRALRGWLLGALVVVFGVVNLAGHSPLFAAVLAWPTPLRSNNHYSDLLHRAGGFLVLVVAAAAGLEAILRGGAATRRAAFQTFAVCTALGLAVYVLIYEADTLMRASFGFSALMAVVTAAVLFDLSRAEGRRGLRTGAAALLAVAFVDVSTQAFLHVRRVIHRGNGYQVIDEKPSPGGIGLANRREDEGYYFVSDVLTMRSRVELDHAGLPNRVPAARLFGAAHVLEDARAEAARLAAVGFDQTGSLALDRSARSRPEARPFLEAAGAAPAVPGRITSRPHSYNRLSLEVEASQPALLFLSDSYSPYWTATVDRRAAPVLQALLHYKAIPVPAGVSQVELRFSPPGIALCLLAAYAALIGAAVAALRSRPKRRPARA